MRKFVSMLDLDARDAGAASVSYLRLGVDGSPTSGVAIDLMRR